jgi:ABC-type branched-subunit amino acid transport system substrate-binding protein
LVLDLRSPKVVAAVALLLLVLAAVAARVISSRASGPYNPDPTSERLTLAYVGDVRGAQPDRDVFDGLRLWREQVQRGQLTKPPTPGRGIPYNEARFAGVRLRVYDGGATPDRSRAAAARAVREGATILVGPPDAARLTAVAEEARRRRALMLAPIPRPIDIPPFVGASYVAFREPGDFTSALDLVDRRVAGTTLPAGGSGRRNRIVILHSTGEWAARAVDAARTARDRAYQPQLIAVPPQQTPNPRRLTDRPTDAVLVAAPVGEGIRWFRSAARPRGPLWVLAAQDLPSAQAAAGAAVVAVAVPWSPTVLMGGPYFGPGEFSSLFQRSYGRPATVPAATGGAIGMAIYSLVQTARSTDPARLLQARERVQAPAFFGVIQFVDGEMTPPPSAVVLLDAGRARTLWPAPAPARASGGGPARPRPAPVRPLSVR